MKINIFSVLPTVVILSTGTVGTATAETQFGSAAAHNPNVQVALGYIQTVWIDHKPVEGYAKYVAPNAIHYPGIRGGAKPEGIAKLLESYPAFTYDVRQVFADGDYVIVHAKLTGVPGVGQPIAAPFPGAPAVEKTGDEVVDIFHVVGGQIVEHWDVVQALTDDPDKSFSE